MNPRASVILAALACAAPLAAQDAPHPRRLLQVVASPVGIVLSLDSALIARTGDSTFVLDAVYRFPRGTDPRVPDRREEAQEVNCARVQIRGRRTAFFFGDAEEPAAIESGAPPRIWLPVDDGELPLFRAICGFLLDGFAARLPTTVEEGPELANPQVAARALSRAYPPLLRDAGQGGTVVLRFRVVADGTVDTATVQAISATHPGFAEAARRVALAMRFHPAHLNGVAVPTWVTIPVRFLTQSGPLPADFTFPLPAPPRSP